MSIAIDVAMSFAEQPDRFVRTLVIAVALWSGVGVVVLATLELALPHHPLAVYHSGPVCETTVPYGAYPAAPVDLSALAVAATSPCIAHRAADNFDEVLRAYLDGAEIDSSPHQAPPAIDAALRAHGAELYQRHCSGCHGATGDGAGANACALQTPPAVHKAGVFALRTTEHEALPTDEDMFRTITRGIHGTAMPPWFVLPERDRWALVAHIKTLSKQFEEDVAPPPIDGGQPPEATPDRLEAGRQLYATRGCASCHGETGHGDGPAAASLATRPRDFTSGRFHRGSSAADIHETLLTGLDGTPMAPFVKVMSADEMWNVSLFVHALAPPMNQVGAQRCPTTAQQIDPQELFGVRSLLRTTLVSAQSLRGPQRN